MHTEEGVRFKENLNLWPCVMQLNVFGNAENFRGQHRGTVVSIVSSQQKGPGFDSIIWLRPFCAPVFLPQSKDMHPRPKIL